MVANVATSQNWKKNTACTLFLGQFCDGGKIGYKLNMKVIFLKSPFLGLANSTMYRILVIYVKIGLNSGYWKSHATCYFNKFNFNIALWCCHDLLEGILRIKNTLNVKITFKLNPITTTHLKHVMTYCGWWHLRTGWVSSL
jgi:hypothetical protein